MNVFGKVAKGVGGVMFGAGGGGRTGKAQESRAMAVEKESLLSDTIDRPARARPPKAAGGQDEDESEVEALLQQISESRHAAERRHAMAQLKDLLPDNPQVVCVCLCALTHCWIAHEQDE